MPSIAILGAQFGDEGKGKIVDFYSGRADIIARFQGGANAGHTIYRSKEKYVFHLLPVGVLTEGVVNVIGPGCVVDILELKKEIETAQALGISVTSKNLKISPRSTVVLPLYISQDRETETRTNNKIGTTRRGIGPAYSAKANRTSLQLSSILDPESFCISYKKLFSKEELFLSIESNYTSLKDSLVKACNFLSPFIDDTSSFIRSSHDNGQSIIFEGAQGALLDNQSGMYPYVTSSSTISSGVCSGAGVPPRYLDGSIGVSKAYVTRVGGGPFPTLMEKETHEAIQVAGKEFGATTGRPRRCGWLDLPSLKYSVLINGYDGIVITKVDVLDSLEEIKICTGYEEDLSLCAKENGFPVNAETLKPLYKTFAGWNQSTRGARSISELPLKLREYLTYIESSIGVPIVGISTGPETNSFIERRTVFQPLPLIKRLERASLSSKILKEE
jgi:adenylosuccinate synthase